MKVRILDNMCQGHGMCHLACPEVFSLGEDGHAFAIVDEIPAHLQAIVPKAVESCPEQAIELII